MRGENSFVPALAVDLYVERIENQHFHFRYCVAKVIQNAS
jgi:hypothetical protein